MGPVRLITPKRFCDERGWFCESWSERTFAALGLTVRFRQDNHSYSKSPGVLRGLHFQRPPAAQAKLVRCVRGRIWDVVVDIRRGSPTFGGWTAAELDPERGRQIFIPDGFAHGFITLEPDTEVEYKASAFYDASAEDGVIWNDPVVAITWPKAGASGPLVSTKDARLPLLDDLESPFAFDGEPLAALEG
ncbi:MAG: dTDP-4-dehydrorhamnose 3,5-epimerase [Caulobacteraceae bacterium]